MATTRKAYKPRKYRQLRKRKTTVKKWSRPPRNTLVYKGNPAIPDRALIKFKYRDNYVLTHATLPTAQRTWRLNSLYDLDYTGTGHQPLGYDQWSAFFNLYRVYKVTVEMDLVNEEQYAVQLLWSVQPDDPTMTGDDSSFEQPHTQSIILAGSNSQNRGKLRRTMMLPKYIGLTSTQYKSSPYFSSQFNTNPTSSIFGILMAQSIDGSTLPNVSVNATFILHAELFDRKEIAISAPISQGGTNNTNTDPSD